METIAQEAKRILEPMPEESWTTYRPILEMGIRSEFEADVRDFLFPKPGHVFTAWGVHNGKHRSYLQETPKSRIMALIDDMIAAGY